jgi:hypothetical protein
MQQAQAINVQFVQDGELCIRHVPTGDIYTTYPASNPDEFYVRCIGGGPTSPGQHSAERAALCEAARPMIEELLRNRRSLSVVPATR